PELRGKNAIEEVGAGRSSRACGSGPGGQPCSRCRHEHTQPARLGEWIALHVVDDEPEVAGIVLARDLLVRLVAATVQRAQRLREVAQRAHPRRRRLLCRGMTWSPSMTIVTPFTPDAMRTARSRSSGVRTMPYSS